MRLNYITVTMLNSAALKPRDWIKVSVKHREKFERLLELWENNPKLRSTTEQFETAS
jgi:hypothetical protein